MSPTLKDLVTVSPAKILASPPSDDGRIRIEDFWAYMPTHTYIFTPSRDLWPGSSVNAHIPPIVEGNAKISATAWLDKNRPITQMTWYPGMPQIIKDKVIQSGGWIDHEGSDIFNLYRAPAPISDGKSGEAKPWIDHVRRLYGKDTDHIIDWLTHRTQRPAEKINHALVLGGAPGIGKDSLLEPVKRAIGSWNFQEVSPVAVMGRFNGFLKSVILRVSEARDQGEFDRYKFYDHSKSYIAAPPDVLSIDEKHLREYCIPNCCGVIITTNYKTDGLYLPPDDRRHFVAWSDRTSSDLGPDYWNELWSWYERGGYAHVGAYLASRDISTFNPKAPPPKTPAFWAIADANRAPEEVVSQLVV